MTGVIVGLCPYSNVSIELTFYECVNIIRMMKLLAKETALF